MAGQSVGISVVKTASRQAKQMTRDLGLAVKFFEEGTPGSLKKLQTLAKKAEVSEVSSRINAMAAMKWLEMKKYKEAEQCMQKVGKHPAVVSRSIRAQLLSDLGRIDEALDVIEGCLNEEQIIFCSSNSSICNETLDAVCERIKNTENSQKQMDRFRNIQKFLTKTNRRTPQTLCDLVRTPMSLEQLEYENDADSTEISDLVIGQTPSFLMKDNK